VKYPEDFVNKVICGNYLEVIKDIPDNSIDMILTDIPYNISRENNFKTMKDRKGRNGIIFGKWDYDFNIESLKAIQNKIKNGGSLIIFSSFEQFYEIRKVFDKLDFKDKIIWEKTNPMPRNRDRRYISNVEIASWYVKGKDWIFNRQDKYHGAVFRYPSESGGGFKRFHPTQKNLELIKKLIMIHSNEGDIVLDILLGGGTTAIACQMLKRCWIGIEISPEYCKIAEARIKPFIEQKDLKEEIKSRLEPFKAGKGSSKTKATEGK